MSNKGKDVKRQTIKEALEDEPGVREEAYRVYVIREGDTVFYVGQSYNTYNRLRGHLGYDERFDQTPTGRFILKCAPQSDSWLFEQYTLDECWDITLRYCGTIPWFWGANWRRRKERYIVNKAEEALIQHYRPCFNVDMNPNPTLPPERYQKLIARIGLKRYRSK